MVRVGITGLGVALPKNYVDFAGGRRYRITGDENHLRLLCESARKAVDNSGLCVDDIDAIIGACALYLQPIPCTAALIHKVLAPSRNIPAFDVNSTCTSFVTALDIANNYIVNGRYKNILIVSGDVPSIGLNDQERHSFELFADGSVSAVVTPSLTSEILYVAQRTYSLGSHLTEVVGGGTQLPPFCYRQEIKSKYQFHMQGKEAMIVSMDFVNEIISKIEADSGFKMSDFDMIIPHQASSALSLGMRKLKIPIDKYIDITEEYGNMVSASIPFALDYAIKNNKVKRGDLVLLIGTAAGLTVSALIMRY